MGRSNMILKLCRAELKVGDKVVARCMKPFNHAGPCPTNIEKARAAGEARYIRSSR